MKSYCIVSKLRWKYYYVKRNKDIILLIHINPSTDTLSRTVKDEVFLRQGDSTNKLSLEQVKVLEYDRQEILFENQINIRSEIEDIDLNMIKIYKDSIGANEIDSLNLLRARKFLVKREGKEYLTNSGVLLFSKDPSVFFPSARVRVIKFEGTKMETGRNLNIIKERYARNPQISRVLTNLGLVRELNEGVERIYTEMKEFFLEEPQYEEPNQMFVKLTLKNNVAIRKERKNENLIEWIGTSIKDPKKTYRIKIL